MAGGRETTVRYLTRAWAEGRLPEAQITRALVAYRARLAEIALHLPPDLLSLTEGLPLYDGRFKAVAYDPSTRRLKVRLRHGDLLVGYFDLELCYEEAEVIDSTVQEVARLADDPTVKLLYHEVDMIGQGQFEHRFLLWPAGELAIRCSDFSCSRESAPGRGPQGSGSGWTGG